MASLAFLALGANLGDRLGTLQSAVAHLDATPGVRVIQVSNVYETEPVGPPQPCYMNAAVRLETTLEPEELLRVALAIEAAHGRERRERWGPRTLDLDLLVMLGPDGSAITRDTPELALPHPRLLERTFALGPLLDVAEELVPQLGATLETLGGRPPRAPDGQSISVPRRP